MLSTEYEPDVAKAIWQAEAAEKAREKEKERFVRNLLVAGMSADEIARIAELSVERVYELKDNA